MAEFRHPFRNLVFGVYCAAGLFWRPVFVCSLGMARGARPEFIVPASWAPFVFVPWCVLTALALARIGLGLWQVRRLRQTCVPVDSAILDAALLPGQTPSCARTIIFCSSALVQMPTAVGFLRPMVVLPEWALRELSPWELHAMLLHELTHLRRWDDWTNLVHESIYKWPVILTALRHGSHSFPVAHHPSTIHQNLVVQL